MSSGPDDPFAAPKAPLEQDDQVAKQEAKRVRLHRIAAWFLGLVAMFAIGAAAKISSYTMGYTLWYVAIATFVLVLIAGLVFGRKEPRQKIRQAWVGLAIWILAWIAIGPWMQARHTQSGGERDAAQAMANTARRNAQEIEELFGDKAKPQASAAPAPTAPAAAPPQQSGGSKGLMQRVQPIAARSQARTMKEVREFAAWTSTLGMGTVLAPASLVTAEGRKRGNETLDKYLAGYEAYHRKMLELSRENRKDLLDAVGDDPQRANFVTGFDKSMNDTMSDYNAMLKIQQDFVSDARKIIDFVGKQNPQHRNGNLIFRTQADADTYNRLTGNIQRLAQQEDAVRARSIARVRSAADRMEAVAPR